MLQTMTIIENLVQMNVKSRDYNVTMLLILVLTWLVADLL